MGTVSDISSQMRAALGINDIEKLTLIYATIESVDKATRTCIVNTVSSNQAIRMVDVMLMASVGDGELKIPSVDSTVVVAFSEQVLPFVALYSDIDEILWMGGNASINIRQGLIQFYDGAYGGLIRVEDLVTRLNNIEKLLSDLIEKYNAHTHTGVQTGTGTSAVTAALENGTITETKREDIENESVKHGKGN